MLDLYSGVFEYLNLNVAGLTFPIPALLGKEAPSGPFGMN